VAQLTTPFEVRPFILVWDLLKKKIASKIFVVRPSDDVLLKASDEKLTNFAEDHILNTVRLLTTRIKHCQSRNNKKMSVVIVSITTRSLLGTKTG
jgi:hypothetical protein